MRHERYSPNIEPYLQSLPSSKVAFKMHYLMMKVFFFIEMQNRLCFNESYVWCQY